MWKDNIFIITTHCINNDTNILGISVVIKLFDHWDQPSEQKKLFPASLNLTEISVWIYTKHNYLIKQIT